MRRGQRKWKCADCGEESIHHWVERNRASRLRCPACGSIHMDPVTKDARNEIVNNEEMRRAAAGYPAFSGPGADK